MPEKAYEFIKRAASKRRARAAEKVKSVIGQYDPALYAQMQPTPTALTLSPMPDDKQRQPCN